jgi:hypothetical protein
LARVLVEEMAEIVSG